MLIDELLPKYDAVERHQIKILAPARIVYEAVRELDLRDSLVVRLLFRLREAPGFFRSKRRDTRLGLTLRDLVASGFIVLGERDNEELVLGLVGRFWTASGSIERMDAGAFHSFATPGFAKAVWNFSLTEDQAGGTMLATETRVLCLDNTSRSRFKIYWTLIAPFSGLIRNEALRVVKRAAERKFVARASNNEGTVDKPA
ncbi:MAG TPA: hypothetical protein VLU47_14815 [Blastocatellia bacterium]|nr:hypothetical protein [Blastocatellia bacterium]